MMSAKGHFKAAKIGNGLNSTPHSTIRNDKIMWLEEETADDALKVYFDQIRALCKTLNQSLFLGLVDFETHFSIFQPDSFYKKHVDQFINSKERRISCVYYLNSNWQESFGGQLKLFDCKDQLLATVLPKANRFICFSSELPHEVCATTETRYSIAGWMKTRSIP